MGHEIRFYTTEIELKKDLSFRRVFVGGHSQGCFLTYTLHMHFPEEIDGTFPIVGGLIIQSEPDVFDYEKLVNSQKSRPIAIVHGAKDNVVPFSTGVYAHNRSKGPLKLSELLSLTPESVPNFADIVLIETQDDAAFFANEQDEDGVRYASRLQTWIELNAGEDRQRETAKDLYQSIIDASKA